MRIRFSSALLGIFSLALIAASGCTNAAVGGSTAIRTYNGTASVGDFLTITIDPATATLTYTDVSNATSGTVPYIVNASGGYTLNDPNGNLVAAYELPGYALVIQAQKTGPGKDTPSLVTAVESGPISTSTFFGKSYNYTQFRTASGGTDIGSITLATGTGNNTSYWPYGALNQGGSSPFGGGTMDFSQLTLSSSGTFLSQTDQSGGTDTIFGTAGGFFIVDTPNGSILGLSKAATKDFLPSTAGTYNAIFYQKTGASEGQGNIEAGTPAMGAATVVVTATGAVTITGPNNSVLAQGTLSAVADTSYLYGSAGELTDPCYGLFTSAPHGNHAARCVCHLCRQCRGIFIV